MNENNQSHAFEKWATVYKQFATTGTELMWPSETLVRLFKGTYVPGLEKNYVGKKVLDIGFGNGNNLIFLASLGLSLCGAEVHEEICAIVRKKLAHLGYTSDLRVGTNRQIPFPDDEFDFLVSWNVIHYENNEQDIKVAIAEYKRALKPGGRFFISTTGPEHKILQNSTRIAEHRYCIGREDDFRKGQVFFYFDTPDYMQSCFSKHFSEVYVGRTHSFLLTENLDWFIATGIKE